MKIHKLFFVTVLLSFLSCNANNSLIYTRYNNNLAFIDKGYTNSFPDEMFPGNSNLKLNQIYQQKHMIYSELIFDEYGNTFFESGNSESELEDFKCKLTCFNLDKKEVVWTYDFISLKIAGNFHQYNKDKVFLPTAKSLICLNSFNGDILWEQEYSDNSYKFWGNFNDKLYVLLEEKTLQCLDENSGNLIWSVPLESKFWYPDYVISDNKTFLCHMNLARKTIFGFDLSNGKKLFEYSPEDDILFLSYKDGIVYLVNNNSIVAYDIILNKQKWVFKKFLKPFVLSKNEIAISDKYLFCRSDRNFSDDGKHTEQTGAFYAIDIKTGGIVWQNKEIKSRDILTCNNYIFHRFHFNELFITDVQDGIIVWKAKYDVAKDRSMRINYMVIQRKKIFAIAYKTVLKGESKGNDYCRIFQYSKE